MANSEDEALKNILDKKSDVIRRHLILSSSVVEMLRKREIIGEYTYKQMTVNRANSGKQIMLLIACLKARGLPTFRRFLDVLRDTFHGWIADDILESHIDVTNTSILNRSSVSVKDLITKDDDPIPRDKNITRDLKSQPYHSQKMPPFYAPTMYQYYSPGLLFPAHGGWISSPDVARRFAKSAYEYSRNRGRESPVSQVPENLRDLQKTFQSEAASARKYLTVLRQEEVTIKALLQQNMRQQQEMLKKQEALTEATSKIKQINDSTSIIFKPEADLKQTRKRLSALQRVPWNVRD